MSLTIQQGLQKVAGEPYQHPRKGVDKQAFSAMLEQKQSDIKVSHHAQMITNPFQRRLAS